MMNKKELKENLINRVSASLKNINTGEIFNDDEIFENDINESRVFDPKNNKQHKEAYNSFVKWYNRWKEKLGREGIRALVKKVSNDALGDNLDVINESLVPGLEDEHLAERIFLTFMHTREIYESFTELLVNSLAKKIRKGVELSQDYLANSSIVEKITKAAIDEEKRASGERFIVNTATRKAVKQKIAENLILRAHDEVDYEDQ